MLRNGKKLILASILIAGILWMVSDSFFQPGIKDLKGGFKELAFIRNEQNTGPVIRVYAAGIQDTLWNEMLKYGNYMPHTKYGVTTVYYFLHPDADAVKLTLNADHIPEKYKPLCIGMYEKNSMSKAALTKYPFINPTSYGDKK